MQELGFTALAERWNVDRSTIWLWWKDGRFEDWRRKGPGKTSSVLIPLKEIERFERQHGLVPPSP
ncbi:MAG: hypothetical protein DHS20C20_04840 [Ardenticatenaceae bacterium]|nr:MAG: hypothetical protein DHS20C20_04840 [Ardenticatenaceae bacterium]